MNQTVATTLAPGSSVERSVDTTADRPVTSHRAWLSALLLIAVTVLAYQPAWNAGFIWDDDVYVTDNDLLIAPDGLRRIWFSLDSPSQYFPLTYTTFRIERSLWGLNSAGYHWVNILLHTVNALLLWRLLKRLNLPAAWLAAAIFSLHPVHVESVAWITERKNVLSLFFCLLSTLAWTEFIRDRSGRSRTFYLLALAAFALALFSKTTACTLPAALLLILWLKRQPIGWTRLAQIAPFVALGLGMGLVTMWWERNHQHTAGQLFALGPLERILIASRAIWFYTGKLIWPVDLAFSYPRWTIDPANPLAYAWLIAGVAAAAAIFYTRRIAGRGIETAVLFFGLTLSPLLGLIMLYTFAYSFVADHYQYVASIGLITLLVAGLTKTLERLPAKVAFFKPAACATLLAALGFLTWRQCSNYADSETLWRATLVHNPDSLLAHVNLGSELAARGQVDDAMVHFKKALEVQPQDAVACYSFGNALLQKGQVNEAIDYFQRAVRSDPADPVAQYDFGVALFQIGQAHEAIDHYQQAIAIRPDYASARFNLGIAFFQTGHIDEAIGQFERVLKIRPDFVDAHYNLGAALAAKGRLRDAATRFEQVLRLEPDHVNAMNNLAWMLATCPDASLRNGTRAVELATRAAQLTGGSEPAILDTLAAAQAEAGQFSEAVTISQKALVLASNRADSGLSDALQTRIGFYQSHSPYRDSSQTNNPGATRNP